MWYNKKWYNLSGYDKDWYDEYFFDKYWIHKNWKNYTSHTTWLNYYELNDIQNWIIKIYDKEKWYNFINKERIFLSKIWFDSTWNNFYEWRILIRISWKWFNRINRNGTLFSGIRYDKAWDLKWWCSIIVLKNKYNCLNIDWSYLYERRDVSLLNKYTWPHEWLEQESRIDNRLKFWCCENVDNWILVIRNKLTFWSYGFWDDTLYTWEKGRYNLFLPNWDRIFFVTDFKVDNNEIIFLSFDNTFLYDPLLDTYNISDELINNFKMQLRTFCHENDLLNYTNPIDIKIKIKNAKIIENSDNSDNYWLEEEYRRGFPTRKTRKKDWKMICDDWYDELNDFVEWYSLVKKQWLWRNFVDKNWNYLF